MPELNILTSILCLLFAFEIGQSIEKEALIEVATIKNLEIPWMWISPNAANEENMPKLVEVIDVVKGKETAKYDDGSIAPVHKSQPRFIGNLKNKLCKVGLGIGCNMNSGMEKFGAKPIIPQDINYVQPLVIQAVGRPIPAIPASDPNYPNMVKPDYSKKNKRPSQRPQSPPASSGYEPVGQYSTPPIQSHPSDIPIVQGGQNYANSNPGPSPPNFKLPMQSFQVGPPQHTIISMDPMTTFLTQSYNPDGNNPHSSNGGHFINAGHLVSDGNLISNGHILNNVGQISDVSFLNGGPVLTNNQPLDGAFLHGGQIINGQPMTGTFLNDGSFISNGGIINDNNIANSHIVRDGHIFHGNSNGGNFINNNPNHINNNIGNLKDFFSNKFSKAELTNVISVPGNGLIVHQPSSSNNNKLDSNSFSVPVDLSFDPNLGSHQSFNSHQPQEQMGPQIFKAEFNAVDLPSSDRPKKDAPHFGFSHEHHSAPPTTSISHNEPPPTQVVQHIHVHKHVHQMDEGYPDTLAKRIQGNLDIISTPAFGSALRAPPNTIREFLEQNEKPPFKRKVELPAQPKVPTIRPSLNDGTCSCVLKDRCPVENVVETAVRDDISFMQDPRNKRSESRILSTSNETSIDNGSSQDIATNKSKPNTNTPMSIEKINATLNPTLLFRPNFIQDAATSIPQKERKILLNIKRHSKRDVSHLFNFDNNFSIKNISSARDLEFPFKKSYLECFEEVNSLIHNRVKRSPQFVKGDPDSVKPESDQPASDLTESDQAVEAANDKENPSTVLSDTHIESLGSRNPKVFLHPYPNVIASHFTKTVSKRKGMPILNDLHDRHFMTPTRHHLNGDILSTNACYYVSCKDLAFYCNSTRTRRRSRPNRTKKRPQSRSDLPFSCGLHEVCCNLDSLDLSLVGTPLSPSSGRSCGTSTVNAVNGRIKSQGIAEGEAKFGEFPWQAAILKKEGTDNVYICAGTFIDESHVLTAAHCVEGYKATQLRVRLGEWDVNRDTEFYSHIEYDAIGVAVHPDFFSGNLINDIALIRMLYPVDLDKNPHISPICLPATGSDYSGRRCWVSGWGKNGFGKNGKYQNLLKKVDVPVVPRQVCQEILRETRLGQDYFLHKGMLCAGGEPEKDACKGDGGGPLSCPDVHGNFVLVGIVSWGIGCGQQGVPGVYTNVEYYRSWISKMIESK